MNDWRVMDWGPSCRTSSICCCRTHCWLCKGSLLPGLKGFSYSCCWPLCHQERAQNWSLYCLSQRWLLLNCRSVSLTWLLVWSRPQKCSHRATLWSINLENVCSTLTSAYKSPGHQVWRQRHENSLPSQEIPQRRRTWEARSWTLNSGFEFGIMCFR